MTKEEILEKHSDNRLSLSQPFGRIDVYEMMAEYAEQEAICFTEWIDDNACNRDGKWYLFGDYRENRFGEVNEDCKTYTTSELYNLYKNGPEIRK